MDGVPAKFAPQPCPRQSQVAIHGGFGDTYHQSRLLRGAAQIDAEFENLGLPRVQPFELAQRRVEILNVAIAAAQPGDIFRQRNLKVDPPLLSHPGSGMIGENPTHGTGAKL